MRLTVCNKDENYSFEIGYLRCNLKESYLYLETPNNKKIVIECNSPQDAAQAFICLSSQKNHVLENVGLQFSDS